MPYTWTILARWPRVKLYHGHGQHNFFTGKRRDFCEIELCGYIIFIYIYNLCITFAVITRKLWNHCSRKLQTENKIVLYGSNEKTKGKRYSRGEERQTHKWLFSMGQPCTSSAGWKPLLPLLCNVTAPCQLQERFPPVSRSSTGSFFLNILFNPLEAVYKHSTEN